jgi:hypothetical protein
LLVAHGFPKFVNDLAAVEHELRKVGTSLNSLGLEGAKAAAPTIFGRR